MSRMPFFASLAATLLLFPGWTFSAGEPAAPQPQALAPEGLAAILPPAESRNANAKNEGSPLAGKIICVDPGHGGGPTGAVGKGGLTEKEINLKVSFYLRDLLEAAGARVTLTRTDDSDIGLGARAKRSREIGADLFVSVHHNANAQGDDSMNRPEVFWHWHDDGGPSEDAARLLAREFRATTGRAGKAYMCYAYGVLRENAYPAILGEMSYLQNPEEEARLRDEAYLRAEAQAYFRAIEAFFAGGRPEVHLIQPPDPGKRRVVHAAALQRDGRSLLDPDAITLRLDGQPVDFDLFYRRADFALLFARLPESDLAGTHTLTLAARNLAGRHSFVRRYPVYFENPWTPPAPPPGARLDEARILGRPAPGAPPAPLAGAELFGQQLRDVYALANAQGVVRLDAAERLMPDPHYAKARGYWTREVDLLKEKEITLEPLFRGALLGKKIVVDPAGGGDDFGPIGPRGLRACDANLETARYLANYLRAAGAAVWMTREADVAMDNVSRVRFGLERHPDLFLTIGYRAAEPGMGEKPGQNVSRAGARWDDGRAIAKTLVVHLRRALGTGAELGDVTSPHALPGEDHNWSSWEVMHATQEYTACHVSPLMFDAPGAEERLSTSAFHRKAAQAMLHGVAQWFGADFAAAGGIEGRVVDEAAGAPIANALVWLNETLLAQTEADGRFEFRGLEPGAYTLRGMALDHKMIRVQAQVEAGASAPVEIRLGAPAQAEEPPAAAPR